MPMGYGKLTSQPGESWHYYSAPEPGLNGRRMLLPRGKGLGGSSNINGLLYVRGQAQDYDDWARGGARGWGWNDVLPYFKRGEKHEQ
jgi:choline dehydrogenase